MKKILLLSSLIGLSTLSADALYNDNYMSRSGIVHKSIDTGIANRVNGIKLLHWKGYVTHIRPIVFDGCNIDEYSSKIAIDELIRLIRDNKSKIKYISIIGYSSSIIDDENRIELSGWASMWHSVGGEHRIEESRAIDIVNSRIKTIYDIIREEGISARKIYNENRVDREPLTTEATADGRMINNRVVVTLYSYSPLNIADLNIHFRLDSAEILPSYDDEVVSFADMLKRNPSMKVTIVGHTDRRGGYDYNMELSKRRAEAVKNKLIELGIEVDRIKTVGKGYTEPIAYGKSESVYRKNRRIEAKLYR